MDLWTTAQKVGRNFNRGTKKFRNLETGLAAFCAFSPLLMILFDGCRYTSKAAACFTRMTDQGLDYEEGIRGAVSSYWDMSASVAFYVPLTVAVMIFVVRGAVRDNSEYNWILGFGLLMLVVFNHDQFGKLHFTGVILFFVGNVVVVGRAIAKNFLNVGVLVGAAFFFFVVGKVVDSNWSGNWILWLEWASLLVIATHFILVAWNPDGYKDPPLSPAKRRELRSAMGIDPFWPPG